MNVWSLFLNIYLIVGTPAVFAGCIGLLQAMIGHSPWDLWVLVLMLVAAARLYVIAQFGQKPGGGSRRLHCTKHTSPRSVRLWKSAEHRKRARFLYRCRS